jgi:hypothetical protein
MPRIKDVADIGLLQDTDCFPVDRPSGNNANKTTIASMKALFNTLVAADVTIANAAASAANAAVATVQSMITQLYSLSGSASKTLSANNAIGAVIDNVGQVGNVNLVLPPASGGMSFMLCAGQAVSGTWKIQAGTNDALYLNGVAGVNNGYVGITPTVGAYLSLFTFRTGVNSWEWMAIVGMGNWSVM